MSVAMWLRKLGPILGLLVWGVRIFAAEPPALPAEVRMNAEAGRGGWIVLLVQLENGEQLPFMVDTGAPITLFDKSLETKLGQPVATVTLVAPTEEQESGFFPAPKLYLDGTRLVTGKFVTTYNFESLRRRSGYYIMGILGMDCLRNYRLQLDFESRRVRFLSANQLRTAELGKAYPLVMSKDRQNFPPIITEAGQNESLPYVAQAGLFGTNTNTLIDLGDNVDGAVQPGVITGHHGTRFMRFLFKRRAMRFEEGAWDGEIYTNLKVGADTHPTRLGLRFLGRHLVTLDFPNATMYLKKMRAEPLPALP